MSLDWTPQVPQHIASLIPYAPGKPIEETKREFGIDEVIKIASNENPLGPSPKALKAITENLKELNIYPDGAHYKLKKRLSEKLGVTMAQISVGNGSNEFIDLLLRVFVPKDCNVVAQKYAFIAYKLCAQLQGCEYREAEVDDDFRISAESLLAKVDAKTRVVFLANPNNPTGTWMGADEVDKLAAELNRRKILLVLDYAYWEYVTESSIPDPIKVLRVHPNVIALKTFSKIYGLAGLRIGYMVADEKVTAVVEKARQPFNVTSVGMDGALAALDDNEFVERSRKVNSEGMQKLRAGLSRFNVTVFPKAQVPQGNFLLVDFKKPTQALYPEFLKRGVIIRPVANYGLTNFFRISVGTDAEIEKCFKVIAEVLK